MRYVVCQKDDVAPGEMRSVMLGGQIRVVLIRDRRGNYRALRDACSHQGALLSAGRLEAMVTDGYEPAVEQDVVRCPWHGFEFDVESGRCPADPNKARVKSYAVEVDGDDVVIVR
ncbi:Biphenyl 2,3-dioxygenase, ferredoxin component [Baekduia alba]|uniref:Rieske (2Fe-2S) protein n=1 Tax=Baekduia alba TaxID=2997333 RepID=UPI00233FF9DE|nr:Rieske (2Fe-2S) protein [Baekduia alba]WCB93353.1 Biphenyl 2,3-dioxygenase, ferredoxin component [Baekduia alba]